MDRSSPIEDLRAAIRSFRGLGGASFYCLEPAEEVPPGLRGSYALVVDAPEAATIAPGRLAPFTIGPGHFVYCGSALGGLRARIDRHLRADKRRHWHVDHLLERAVVVEIWIAASLERLECPLANHLTHYPQAYIAAPRFGSSDCHCAGHLLGWNGTLRGG